MRWPWQRGTERKDTEEVTSAAQEIRKRNLAILAAEGFRVAPSLPFGDATPQLRPADEIAARLMALDALFTWVAFSEEDAAADRVCRYIERNSLLEHLTDEERGIAQLPRPEAYKEHVDTIGWRLENIWSLAWVLGFDPPPAHDGQIPQEVTGSILNEFLPGLDTTVSDLVSKSRPRPVSEVAEAEDLFYCFHNAVRSAQLGHPTVLAGFHPVADGGAVHERRHALTWCLSPGVAWDDTDLST